LKTVVDTNVLFSFFKEDSFTRRLIILNDIEWIAPEQALHELRKYSDIIAEKSHKQVEPALEILREYVQFFKLEDYSTYLGEAERLFSDLSDAEKKEAFEDIDFVALALKEQCPLWSNDKLLKKQNKISVFTTTEMAKLLN